MRTDHNVGARTARHACHTAFALTAQAQFDVLAGGVEHYAPRADASRRESIRMQRHQTRNGRRSAMSAESTNSGNEAAGASGVAKVVCAVRGDQVRLLYLANQYGYRGIQQHQAADGQYVGHG
jgi:hypothetical protein